MNALDTRKAIQALLNVTQDGQIGPKSLAALNTLIATPDTQDWPPKPATPPAPAWPFTMHVDGDDLVSDPNIVITCFGGNGDGTNSDPQDDGGTASGQNTNNSPLQGVSVAMDGRSFPHLSPAEHRALDGAPIPKLPWGTQVVIIVGNVTIQPKDGIIDLGPGLQASKPGEPHALDLTVASAKLIQPGHSNSHYANDFEVRGRFRVLGGAKVLS